MNWWNRPEWAGFCAAVASSPADDTDRLVACDWLEERDDETAHARAAVIRAGCARNDRGLYVERHVQYGTNYRATYPAFPEPVFRDLARFETVGGFPVGVTFYSWKFDKGVALALRPFPVRRADLWPFEPDMANPDNPATAWDIGYQGPEGESGYGFRPKSWLTTVSAGAIITPYVPVWEDIQSGMERETILTRFYNRHTSFVPREVWAHLRRGPRGGTIQSYRRAAKAYEAVAKATFLALLHMQGVNPTDPRPPVANMPVTAFGFGETCRRADTILRETFPEVYAAGPVG